ncbi:MAG: hypothetical protein KF830_06695 [Planctomycetes bacterium]|nr:hypothetical protein [Planctomycetota bacterium]
MTTPVPPASARDSLRRLAVPHALHFGSRLLHRGHDGVITFREFVAVARELVAQRPEQTAVYLAALVALDMHAEPEPAPAPRLPSAN